MQPLLASWLVPGSQIVGNAKKKLRAEKVGAWVEVLFSQTVFFAFPTIWEPGHSCVNVMVLFAPVIFSPRFASVTDIVFMPLINTDQTFYSPVFHTSQWLIFSRALGPGVIMFWIFDWFRPFSRGTLTCAKRSSYYVPRRTTALRNKILPSK